MFLNAKKVVRRGTDRVAAQLRGLRQITKNNPNIIASLSFGRLLQAAGLSMGGFLRFPRGEAIVKKARKSDKLQVC